MGKAKYDELDAHGWFERADHFHYSSIHLGTQPQELQFIYARPHIVLKAFASEAYLKSLLCIEEREFEKIHDLLALFDLLSPSSRKLIEKWWNKGSKPVLDGARKHAVGAKAPKTLRGALDESSHAFLDWRYHGKEAYIGFSILGFPTFVRKRILQLKPEWTPAPHNPLYVLDPEAEFVERKNYSLSIPVRVPILNPKAPSFKASLRAWRGSDPKDRSTGK